MPTVLGVDGCPHGWCAVQFDTDALTLTPSHHDTFRDVLLTFPQITIAIDVPIGLVDGAGGRDCDREARRYLGRPRASSVFPPPARKTLTLCGRKENYAEACRVNREETGVAISLQAFYIGPKIREVDLVMNPDIEKHVYEVHPEVCFAAIAGHPMSNRKSRRPGREERWRHLRKVFPQLPPEPARPAELGRVCDLEDYTDAIACAWTAARIAADEGVPMPEKPIRDGCGLRMAIWR
ncbi:MAG TPA: DUF429 domain-containing protein [Dehalococcoidia bacterium]